MKNNLVTSCPRRSTISLAIDITLEGKGDMTEGDPDVFKLEMFLTANKARALTIDISNATPTTSAKSPDRRFLHSSHVSTGYRFVKGVIHLPGRQRIITCSDDGSLRLWNCKNGLQIGKDWRDGESRVSAIALSPDGKTVASGSGDGAVRLWDIERGKMVDKWTGHSGEAQAVSWGRDGERLGVVSDSGDRTMKVWSVECGDLETLGPITTATLDVVCHATVYSPDQTMIATGGKDIKIWDAKTFELLTTLTVAQRACSLVWAADGKTLISGSHEGGSIITWNTTTWKRIALWPTEHRGCVYAIAISPNGRILASASLDCTARLWNLENGQPISSPLRHPRSIYCISFSVGGELLATGCDDNNAYTWDVTAIVKEAGFKDLLLDSDLQDSVGKSVLDVDTTLRPSKPPNNTHRLPGGFFDDTGNHNHSSSTGPPRPSRSSVLRDRFKFSLPFRRSDPAGRDSTSHGTASLSRPVSSTLTHFSRQHRSGGRQRPPEVEVPYTQGRLRNVNATAKSKGKTSQANNIMTMTVRNPSQPPIGTSAGQQSSGVTPGQQSSSQSQVAVTTAPTATTAATSTSVPPTHMESESTSDMVVIRQVGCWTRFWLFLGCIPTENPR